MMAGPGKASTGISERSRSLKNNIAGLTMNEPTITCPSCKSEIKLTESLAAPLIEATRRQFEHTIAEKEQQVANREAAIYEQKTAIEKARGAIDEQVSEKLKAEREKII